MKTTFILTALFFVSCGPKSTDSTATDHIADTSSISKNGEEEDFNQFFKKFTTDSVFQMQRTKFPFRVIWLTEEGETTHETDKENWTHPTFYFEDSYATRPVDAYTQKIKIYTDSATLEQRGVDNGIYVDYLFLKDKGKWILNSGRDYSN
jgi:hypothetical protein